MNSPSLIPLTTLAEADLQQVNEVILASVRQPVPLITNITHHIVRSGGKRLRPCLTIACAKLLGYSGVRHINLAAAVELIHTATLLHDDVVDESTMRRGLETANHVWSNQASVLVGDFLLSRAFQLMVADASIPVLRVLSDASATISQGEVKQLMASGNVSTTLDTYLEIIHAKTAVLFSAACEIAPLIMDRQEKWEHFKAFGTHLGIAFQLVDDALDYTADAATLGKAVGDDLREGKMTMPVILAYASGSTDERAFWQRVIEEGEVKAEDVEQAIMLISHHGTAQATLQQAKQEVAFAANALDAIEGDVNVAAALHETLAFCVARGH